MQLDGLHVEGLWLSCAWTRSLRGRRCLLTLPFVELGGCLLRFEFRTCHPSEIPECNPQAGGCIIEEFKRGVCVHPKLCQRVPCAKDEKHGKNCRVVGFR